MTNRQTKGFGVKNTKSPYRGGTFRFKGRDSYCYSIYNSSVMAGSATEGVRHAK